MTIRRRPDRPFVLVGAGEFGRDCLSVVEALRAEGGMPEFRGWIDDGRVGESVSGYPVLGGIDWLIEQGDALGAVVAIGRFPARRAVAERLDRAGVPAVNLVHPTATVGDRNTLGAGVVLMAHVDVTIDAFIGNHVGVNPACTIAHDVRIGDYGYLSPGARFAGRATLGEAVYVGIGASVLPSRTVGTGATIGAGAVVVHDVAPGTTVVGVPARPLDRP